MSHMSCKWQQWPHIPNIAKLSCTGTARQHDIGNYLGLKMRPDSYLRNMILWLDEEYGTTFLIIIWARTVRCLQPDSQVCFLGRRDRDPWLRPCASPGGPGRDLRTNEGRDSGSLHRCRQFVLDELSRLLQVPSSSAQHTLAGMKPKCV